LAHKIVFSILAWITFAVLLAGRHLWHWRGRRAVHLVLGGFVLLALGFFGSKVALELILERA
ncbi:MAG: cytochrome c biogenesis protein CcsA, partial [Gammaproteobacteria bacterium]